MKTQTTTTAAARNDVYETITNKIIEALEAGATKWELPWTKLGGSIMPINVTSKKPYRGINTLALFIAADIAGYSTGLWATFNQWKALGATIRKGEKGTVGVFFKGFDAANDEDGEEDKKGGVYAKSFNLFNAAQVDGYEMPITTSPNTTERINAAENYFANARPIIRNGGDRAFYSTTGDYIQLPNFEQFTDTLGYYGTLAHEATHWTGHASRCKRDLTGRFGSEAYAAEELVAELGAAFLSARLGLTQEPRQDHAAYIGSWLKVLRQDKRAIFTAASLAQKGIDYMDALQPQPSADVALAA